MDDILVGLDVGTSRVTAVIGEYNDDGRLEIMGVGTCLTVGVRRGVVVNIESALKSVVEAVENAEQMAGREVHEVIAGISGGHIEGLNSRGIVAITGKGREINSNDMERVIEAAKAVVIPMDRDVLHVIPQDFIVDDQGGIKDPIGMIGVRLESEVHIITGSVTSAQNLVKCINRAGFKVGSLTLGSLAAARAVLSEDEQELGVLLLDLGAGTSNILIYRNGAPYFTSVLPIGGAHVTSDLSLMLKIPVEAAERLKCESGRCHAAIVKDSESIIVPGVGGRSPEYKRSSEIADIIEPRVAEILIMARDRIEKKGYLKYIGGGVVLTGGGANLPGIAELAQQIFRISARVGQPGDWGGVTKQYRRPDYSTAVGLVLYADRSNTSVEETEQKDHLPRVFRGVKNWLRNFFE